MLKIDVRQFMGGGYLLCQIFVVTKIWVNELDTEPLSVVSEREGCEKMETNSEMKAKVLAFNARSGSLI